VRALILVDLQYDFMPGGALTVPGGDEVVAVANGLMSEFDWVVATQDWHPADHLSFASQHPGKVPGDEIELAGVRQTLWPDHCVQGARGAELHADLDQSRIAKIVRKGTDRWIDSYSAFYDNARKRSTGLEDLLRARAVDEVVLMGLASDYCVKYSVLDALQLGFGVEVRKAGCRGIDLHAGDVERAWSEMRSAGAKIV